MIFANTAIQFLKRYFWMFTEPSKRPVFKKCT